MIARRKRAHAAAVALVFAFGGCGSVPTQNYYVLTPLAATTGGVAAGAGSGGGAIATPVRYVIQVETAHVPEAVDRPQLVIANSDNRVTILEQQRWAAPLRAAIAEVIALDLGRLLEAASVTAAPLDTLTADTYVLALDVQRFDSRPGDSVSIEIAWTLRRGGADAGRDSRIGRSSIREPVVGSGYDAIAIAHSKALATISREIAASIDSAALAPQRPRAPAL
ncbi:MAG: PqiC family protein [Casimicrobiaceae bacterium]